jgi:Flagellar transcriptional activator (FlhD)
MTFDFSQVNLQYLIRARDIARHDPQLASTLTGMPEELAQLLAEVSAEELAHVAQFKAPLLIPRQEAWWWSRLFTAIRDGRPEEVQAIMEHASLITVR